VALKRCTKIAVAAVTVYHEDRVVFLDYERHETLVRRTALFDDAVFYRYENALDTIAMAEMVFGRESLEETPAIISLINVNSPLRYDDRMLSALVEYAKAGQATVITPFLLMGAMSPVSVPATLAQQVGEALAGIASTVPGPGNGFFVYGPAHQPSRRQR